MLNLGTSYVDVTSSSMITEGAGIEFPGLTGGSIDFIAPFSDPLQIQNVPINYGDSYSDDFQLFLSEHIDSIPGLRTLIDSINPTNTSPDSIRLNLEGNKTAEVDAFGTLTGPNDTYDVLRQKVERTSELTVEIYVAVFTFGTWVDITSTFAGFLPFQLKDTTNYYDHLAPGVKEPIVRLNMDNSGASISSIEFKSNNNTSSVLENQLSAMNVYPNPSDGRFNLNIPGLNVSEYDLKIVDSRGRIQHQKSELKGYKQTINASELAPGTYLLLLSSEEKLLARERIVVSE